MAATPGERIKALRERRGMTQDDLADYLSMNRANVSNYERGIVSNIPGEVLNKLADLFGVTTDYILCRTDDPHGYAGDLKSVLLRDEVKIVFNGKVLSKEEKNRVLKIMDALLSDEKGKEG